MQSAIHALESQWSELLNANTDEIVADQDEKAEAVLRQGELASQQPENAGLWLNEGVLTFWNGEQNKKLDFSEGTNTSLFGTVVGDI